MSGLSTPRASRVQRFRLRPHRRRAGPLLLVGLWLVGLGGCGEEGEAEPGPADADAAGDDADGGAGGEPDAASPSCPELLAEAPQAGFALDPEGPDTQIHAALLFDGEGLWAAYNLPKDDGDFAVWATRLDCSGAVSVPPFRVDAQEGNSVDPTLAASGERLLVVWQTDDHGAEANLSIRYRLFDLAGTALMAEEREIEGRTAAVETVGNTLFPAVSGLADGFVVAGSHGTSAAPSFQVFLEWLGGDGEPIGTALDVALRADATQTWPALVANDVGDVYIAWTEEVDERAVMLSRVAAGAQAAEPAAPAVVGLAGEGASLGVAAAAGPHLAFGSADGQIVLADVGPLDGDPDRVALGAAGRIDHTPAVAATPDGGAVAWYRNVQGLSNEVWALAFAPTGEGYELGPELRIDEEGRAAPYPPAIAHVGGASFLIAWSEGQSPDFRIAARFVSPASAR